jgi:DNA-binding GntR family transcriptional regulator
MLRLEEVEIKIRNAILRGEYRAGERLIEADLISKYEASRTIVREALRNLNATGLLRYIPKKGHSVRKFSLEEIQNTYDLICLMEGYACKIATPLFMKQDMDALKGLQDQIKGIVKKNDFKKYRELNTSFHGLFVNLTGNKVLKEEIITLRTRINTYRYLPLMIPGALENYTKDHETIIKCVIRQEPQKVKLAMQKHIKRVKDNLIIAIENSPLR